jgi:hypothetical protein
MTTGKQSRERLIFYALLINASKYLVTKQDGAMHVERNIEARSCNHFCSGKAIFIKYSECDL